MKDKQEKALLKYLNKEEEIKTLDPKGICSEIIFKSATVEERDNILHYSFEVQLAFQKEDSKTVNFTYQPSVLKIMDKEEHMHLEFIREFETYFIQWMEEHYY